MLKVIMTPMRHLTIISLAIILLCACSKIEIQNLEDHQKPSAMETLSATLFPTQSMPVISTSVTEKNPVDNSWFSKPANDPQLLEHEYGFLNNDNGHIYSSLQDFQNEPDHFRLPPKRPAYLAYDQVQFLVGQEFVHLTDGGWLQKKYLDPVSVTSFSGIILNEQSDHSFGWVLKQTEGFTTSQANTSSANTYFRYQVVQISNEENGFAQLSSGDWLPVIDLAIVDPTKKLSDHPAGCRWIDVDLKTQALTVYEKCQIIFATLISSAKTPAYTPLGSFAVFYKEERLPLFANERIASSEGFYLADVPWLMFFYENWAIHGTYWHDHFGEPWSHGCINVSPYDARWLYQWSKLGDIIVIHE